MANTNFLQGRGFQGHTLTIASVFPRELKAERHYNPEMSGGRFIFRLEGAPKGQFRTIGLSDCWEQVQNANSRIGAPEFDATIVLVENIAQCLLKEWATNIAGTRTGKRPGIMLIAGEQPTEAELATLNAMQATYFDGLIQEGDGLAAKHDFKSISELHRDAAKWRGHDAAWVTNLGEGQEKKECIHCAEKILARANFCRYCRQAQPGFEGSPVAESVAPKATAKAPLPPPVKAPQQVAA